MLVPTLKDSKTSKHVSILYQGLSPCDFDLQWAVHNAGDYTEGQQNFETCIYFVSVVNK